MYRKRYETLGNAIKYHRVSKSISQGALAAMLEITPSCGGRRTSSSAKQCTIYNKKCRQ